ncbi:LysR family transcriptional regulator [Marinomonas sp. M1K-6]|uniref:LysR family transcriptional regulator n=1 Tax=Marinomonas profundi TaxID=2726122 RepID=A0A847QVY9_9GAMM|nr:LysR family transcriptional regulator [Marinomonas profundi]NLQ17348.1 LysR family transcriptional regulator [Marinomonas profundi]UDV01876.1 LysR family transcriptional regulator [Marinomonas profundi]
MRFRKLNYFITVAEELHFGRAAARLHIAQPPLSQQIKAIEDELGAVLFERSSQKVSLTPAGEALLPQARALLQNWEKIQEQVRSVANGTAGTMSLGFVWAAGTPHFSKGIAQFKQDNHGVTLNLEEMTTTHALDALRTEKIDLAMIFLNPLIDVTDLEHQDYETQKHLLALPENHPLAQKDSVPLSDLHQLPFISFARQAHPSLYDQIMHHLHVAGVEPNIVQVARLTQTTRTLVAAGVGIALVPESTQFDQREGLTYRPIDGALPELAIHFVWRKNNLTPLMERLIAHLQAQVPNQ